MSEVRGSGREDHPAFEVGGGGMAERSHPASEARGGGREVQPPALGQGWWTEGATPRPRSGGCAGTGGPRVAIPR